MGLPLAFYIIFVILLAWFVTRQTRYGRYLFAVGGKIEAAYETGVPVSAVQFSTYVISGLMAALGGIAITLLTGSGNAQVGDALTLQAITAVVIGGTILSGGKGGIAGAIIGAIILGLIRNIISFANVESWWQTFVNAAIIVLALAMPGILSLIRRKRVMSKRLTISPPLAAVLLAVVLFLLSGLLPNGFGSNPDVAMPHGGQHHSYFGVPGHYRCRANPGDHQRRRRHRSVDRCGGDVDGHHHLLDREWPQRKRAARACWSCWSSGPRSVF